MNRESRPIGLRISIIAAIGVIVASATGALASYWLISGAEHPAAHQRATERARIDRAAADNGHGEPDGSIFVDPVTGLPNLDPAAPDEAVCGADRDQADTMLEDWTPDHGDDPDDWLLALATIMGLAEGWTNDAAGPWSSCHM